MKKRPSLLRRILDRVKGRAPSRPDAVPPKAPQPRRKKRMESSFEPLDDRIAPATIVNATTVSFMDLDGDLVTVKFSKPLFGGTEVESVLTAQSLFRFKNAMGDTVQYTGHNDVGEQLQLIALDAISAIGAKNPATGTSITITATPQGGMGDGFTNVGHIRAESGGISGVSLNTVRIDGDLGQIDVGDPSAAVGLKSLTVESIGAAGLSSQGAGGSLESTIIGALGRLIVKGDVVDASINAADGFNAGSVGKIGNVSIGGALKTSAGNTDSRAGTISSEAGIGAVKIQTIIGGEGDESGGIFSEGSIKSLSIAIHIRGGDGENSGEINAAKGIGKIQLGGGLWAGTGGESGRIVSETGIGAIIMEAIHGEETFEGAASGDGAATISATNDIASLVLRGSLSGGVGDASGFVQAGGRLGSLSIGHSLIGGFGATSGHINVGALGNVVISKVLTGGEGDGSGAIISASSIGGIAVKNEFNVDAAITAGLGESSGSISADGSMGRINVGGTIDASMTGAGESSGSILAGGAMAGLTVYGDILGGESALSGSVAAGGSLGAVKISGDLAGGAGRASGSLLVAGKIASAEIGGGLLGGAGADSGSIVAGEDSSISGDLGRTSVAGGLTGGDGLNSGSIRAGGKITALTLGVKTGTSTAVVQGGGGAASATVFGALGIGSVTVFGNVEGGGGENSAGIFAEGSASKITITGELRGGTGDGSASVSAFDRLTDTGIAQGALGTVKIGSLAGGDGIRSAQIFADGSLKTLMAGSVNGGAGANSGSILTGQGLSALDDDYSRTGGANSVVIRGAVAAGAGANSAEIETGGALKKLTIGGSVTDSAIRTGRNIGSLVISGPVSGTLVSASGVSSPTATSDLAMGNVTINGSVTGSQFLAGYDRFGNAENGNAQVGKFAVNGDWTASSLVAGAEDVNGDGFGNADDAVIGSGTISKIASIFISGNVTGTVPPGDHFGFVAQVIAKAKIGGAALPLTAAKDVIPLAGTPATDDTSLLEIP